MERTAEEFVHQLPSPTGQKAAIRTGKAKPGRWFVADTLGLPDGLYNAVREDGTLSQAADLRWVEANACIRTYATKASAKRAAARWLERALDGFTGEPDEPVPPCAASMGCLCAGHARGNPADASCDTTEAPPTSARRRGSVKRGRLLCPDGHDGPHRYVETIQCWRDVGEISGPVIQVDSGYHTGEGYDDGADGYFECHADLPGGGMCLGEFELPDGIEIDWV